MSWIRIMTFRLLAIEVYKCVKKFNPEYFNDIFILKESPYGIRDDSILVRPKVNTTNYGLKSFRNYGSKIWNILSPPLKKSLNVEDFKLVIHSWNGPQCSCPVCDFIHEVTFLEYAFRMTRLYLFCECTHTFQHMIILMPKMFIFYVIVCLITAFYRFHWISPNPLLRVLLGLFCHLFTFNLYTYFTTMINMSRLSHVCDYVSLVLYSRYIAVIYDTMVHAAR